MFCYAHPNPAPVTTHTLESDLPRIGIKHFALRVTSIEKTRLFLIDKGFASDITISAGRTGVLYFFIQDHNQIFLEIVEDNRCFSEI